MIVINIGSNIDDINCNDGHNGDNGNDGGWLS